MKFCNIIFVLGFPNNPNFLLKFVVTRKSIASWFTQGASGEVYSDENVTM